MIILTVVLNTGLSKIKINYLNKIIDTHKVVETIEDPSDENRD